MKKKKKECSELNGMCESKTKGRSEGERNEFWDKRKGINLND